MLAYNSLLIPSSNLRLNVPSFVVIIIIAFIFFVSCFSLANNEHIYPEAHKYDDFTKK